MPYPANYGGAVEEFYKIKALHQLGVKIILHCFVYNKFKENDELNEFCHKIYYYERKNNMQSFFATQPFIVKSRANKNLLQNLSNDKFPILFEGIHTTAFLNHASLKDRTKIVRLHNVEHLYYYDLYKNSNSITKKLFYYSEYTKLKKYEDKLKSATYLLPISISDKQYYTTKFSDKNVHFVPTFHQFTSINTHQGNGRYILLHGNLSIEDNYSFFINNYKYSEEFDIIFAGKEPTQKLKEYCTINNIQLIENPTDIQLFHLIQNAQINLVFSSINTGIKLKLLHCLFVGRFCFANEEFKNHSEFSTFLVGVNGNNFNEQLKTYMRKSFSEDEIEQRKILEVEFNNLKNANTIFNLM